MTEKAVLTTREAWAYVGGRGIFESLLEEFPDLIPPFQVCKPTRPGARGKTKYLRTNIDTALKAAQLASTFIR